MISRGVLLLILIVILIIVILFWEDGEGKRAEHYTYYDTTYNPVPSVPPNELGKLGGNGFPERDLSGFPNSTKPDVSQVLYDPTFEDVVTYNNDDDPYKEGQLNGINKCLNFCEGTCVEFGPTGIAFCYPATHVEPYVNPH